MLYNLEPKLLVYAVSDRIPILYYSIFVEHYQRPGFNNTSVIRDVNRYTQVSDLPIFALRLDRTLYDTWSSQDSVRFVRCCCPVLATGIPVCLTDDTTITAPLE